MWTEPCRYRVAFAPASPPLQVHMMYPLRSVRSRPVESFDPVYVPPRKLPPPFWYRFAVGSFVLEDTDTAARVTCHVARVEVGPSLIVPAPEALSVTEADTSSWFSTSGM